MKTTDEKIFRVLVIEDNQDDYDLLLRSLSKVKKNMTSSRVDNADDLITELSNNHWDLIISDNSLPGGNISIDSSLKMARELDDSIPFLIVSGTLEEGKATEFLRQGVNDFIPKSNMKRLESVVNRIIEECDMRTHITEVENLLTRTSTRYRRLADSIGDMFFDIDRNLICTYWNASAEKFTGVAASLAVGKSIFDVLPSVRGTAIEERVMASFESGQPDRAEMAINKNPGRRYFEVSIYPATEVVSIIVKDTTRVKLAESRLKATMEELETFMYRVSHDIRGPVSSLLGLTHLMKSEYPENEAITYFDETQKAANRLDEIVKALVDITRIRQEETNIQVVELDDLIRRVTLGAHVDPNEILLTVSMDFPPVIYSDPRLMEIIFSKIIQNAVTFRNKEVMSTLDITMEHGENNTVLRFKDNGCGIQHDQQEKIFNMFYRGNENSTGPGLGLYLVKRAVEKLGGSIEVVSEYSKGASFTVLLPNYSFPSTIKSRS